MLAERRASCFTITNRNLQTERLCRSMKGGGVMSEDVTNSPADYITQQLLTIHDKKLWRLLASDCEYGAIVARLQVLAWRRPSPLQWLRGIDDRVGATNALLIMDPDGVSDAITVYFVRPPAHS